MTSRMWGGRFAEGPDAIMEEINASIDFDKNLFRQDIAASKAHARMLAARGIIAADLADKIGVTVFLGVWGNRGPTIIYRVDGPLSETVLDIRVGSVLPILRSAVGRYLLGWRVAAGAGRNHSDLAETVLAGDADGAGKLVRQHLDQVRDGLEEIMVKDVVVKDA